MKKVFAFLVIAPLSLLAAAASAETFGAVKVECWGRCDLVDLGQICDSFSSGATPSGVACDDTSVGRGTELTCGSATCRAYGTLARSDLLSDYCDDGGGYDAVVTCKIP